MSHVEKVEADTRDQQIADLDALERAARRVGLELRRDQQHFHTYATDNGSLVGDYPVPEGYTESEIVAGKCAHALGIPGKQNVGRSTEGYEIGLVSSKKFPGTYSLLYDYYGGAIDKHASTGKKGNPRLDLLMMYYQIEVARGVAQKRGMGVMERAETNGRITLIATKAAMGTMG